MLFARCRGFVFQLRLRLQCSSIVTSHGICPPVEPLVQNFCFLFRKLQRCAFSNGAWNQAVELTENLKLARGIHVLDVKVKNHANGDL